MVFGRYVLGGASSVTGFAPRAVRPTHARVVRAFCDCFLNRSDNLLLPSVSCCPDRIKHLGLSRALGPAMLQPPWATSHADHPEPD